MSDLLPADEIVRLSDEELSLLTDEELADYQSYLESVTSDWTLQPKQMLAEELTKTCNIVGFGGAAGPGKSEWGLWHVYELSKRIPRHASLVLRTVLPELKRSLIRRSLEKFDPAEATYRPGDKEWRFKNGSVIEFGYLETDDDVYQYKSAEYDCIFIDEATEVSEFAFDYLRTRARTPLWKYKLGARPHVILATNPEGKGFGWFKRRLVLATDYGRKIAEVEVRDPVTLEIAGTRTTAFVPATLADNAYIDPEYKLNLMQQGTAKMKALLLGSWDSPDGQFFSEWMNELHVVESFRIPESWPRVRSIDYGFAAPYACYWTAFDEDGNGYVYRERYKTGLTATQQAQEIIAASVMVTDRGAERPEKIAYTVADPSIWSRQGSGISIAAQYRDAGLGCKKAMNARVDGWSVLREWLRPDEQRGVPGPDGTIIPKPRLRIFPECQNLIRTLPDLVHDPKNPEDIEDGEDHAADAIRYMVMSRPRRAKPVKAETPDTLEARLASELDRLSRSGRDQRHPVMGRMRL